jgi:hypothetical protein
VYAITCQQWNICEGHSSRIAGFLTLVLSVLCNPLIGQTWAVNMHVRYVGDVYSMFRTRERHHGLACVQVATSTAGERKAIGKAPLEVQRCSAWRTVYKQLKKAERAMPTLYLLPNLPEAQALQSLQVNYVHACDKTLSYSEIEMYDAVTLQLC